MRDYPICKTCGEPYCPDCSQPLSAHDGQVGALKTPKNYHSWDNAYPGTNHSYLAEFLGQLFHAKGVTATPAIWKKSEHRMRVAFATPAAALSQWNDRAAKMGLQTYSTVAPVHFPSSADFWQWVAIFDQDLSDVYVRTGIGLISGPEEGDGQVGWLKAPKSYHGWDNAYPEGGGTYLDVFLLRLASSNKIVVAPTMWGTWKQRIRSMWASPAAVKADFQNYNPGTQVQFNGNLLPSTHSMQFWAWIPQALNRIPGGKLNIGQGLGGIEIG